MKALATKNAPGMQPEGAAGKDTLAADGHKGQLITMQGGKCYTIVAFSPPGQITNLDLHLLLPPFYNMEAGHDAEADNTATVGKGTAAICPALQFPVQYKLDVHAKAAQVSALFGGRMPMTMTSPPGGVTHGCRSPLCRPGSRFGIEG